MSVSNGQKANATNFNNAFLSRTVDSNTIGKIDLENAAPESGTSILNVQKELNSQASFVGQPVNQDADLKPTWNSDSIGAPNDDVKTRVDSVQAQVEINVDDIADHETRITQNEADIAANTSDISDIRTTTGTADSAVDMGSYTAGSNGFNLTASQSTKANIQELINEVDLKIDLTEKGAAGGVATLDGSGLVPASQLPSYVDDVLEYADLASFPVTGETGKIYIALDTNFIYRWTGSIYVDITSTDFSIDALNDVDTTTTPPNNGDALVWDGSNWVPGTGGISWSDPVDAAIVPDTNASYAIGAGNLRFTTLSIGLVRLYSGTSTLRNEIGANGFAPSGGGAGAYYTTSEVSDGLAVYTKSNNNASASGNVYIESGNNSIGNSGNVQLQTGTAGGSRGKIKFVDGSEGTVGQVWTSDAVDGSGSWQDLPSVQGGINYIQNSDAETNVNNTSSSANCTISQGPALRGDFSFQVSFNASASTADYAEWGMDNIELADNGGTMFVSFDYSTHEDIGSGFYQVVLRESVGGIDYPVDNGNNGLLYATGGVTNSRRFTGRVSLDPTKVGYTLRIKPTASHGINVPMLFERMTVSPDTLVPGAVIKSTFLRRKVDTTTAQSIPINTSTVVDFQLEDYDTENGWVNGVGYNSTLGTWTTEPGYIVPYDGYYKVSSNVTLTPLNTSTATAILDIRKSGTTYSRSDYNPDGGPSGQTSRQGTATIYCVAGDKISVAIFHSSAAPETVRSATGNIYSWIEIERLPQKEDSALLSTTETLFSTGKARMYLGATQIITVTGASNNLIEFDAESFSTPGLTVDTVNHRIVANKKGYYYINAHLRASGGVLNEAYRVYLYKNGAAIAENNNGSTTGGGIQILVSTLVEMDVGDYIDATVNSAGDTDYNVFASPISTYLEVFELPDFSTFSVYGQSEYLEVSKTRTATGIPAIATYADMLELDLSPGEWDLTFQGTWGTSRTSTVILGISSTPGNVNPGNEGSDKLAVGVSAPAGAIILSNTFHKGGVVVTQNTTYYAKFYRTNTSVDTWGGKFMARRIK